MTTPAIALIPLDDRPCNRLFPQQLAEVAGSEVLLPPREQLGWFTRPGDCEAIAEWLQACAAERVVVALDMWCYGGLVASRTSAVEEGLALARLGALRELRRARPELRLFAFSVIMRLGTTVDSPEALAIHQALFSYSQLVDRVQRLGDEQARPELEAVLEQLDGDILSQYLAVRRRNHGLNRAAIGLVSEGVVDYLVLAQEDAAPLGIHIPEQLALQAQVEEFRAPDRVAIHPGADEVGLVLMARHHLASAGGPLRVAVDYASGAGGEVVPQFECQPLRETVESQIRAAGARPVPVAEADAVLFAHTPIQTQSDVAEAPPVGHSPMLAAQAESVVERTRAASEAGLPVGLVDVAYANGADPELIAALGRSGGADHLAAFAAWNTAANSIGTVVSQLCLAAGEATPSGREAAARFLACRLLDDYGYQSCVRQRAAEQAAALGASPYRLGEACAQVEEFVRRELKPFAHHIHSDLLGSAGSAPLEEAGVSLPWRRLFEVEIELPSGASKNRA
jgi:hypothetical protein